MKLFLKSTKNYFGDNASFFCREGIEFTLLSSKQVQKQVIILAIISLKIE